MILGNIVGKSTTNSFKFLISGNAKKFQYIQILNQTGEYVLGQIVEIEKEQDRAVADCVILGYKEGGKIQKLRYPLEPGVEVLDAEDQVVSDILSLELEKGAYVGKLDGRNNLDVYLDMNKLLTKHVAVLAKSGSGKSYTVAVLLEELIERKVPILVIDPHGEYSSLKWPNEKDKEIIKKFGIESKGYLENIQEFSPDISLNTEAKPLKLSSKNLDSGELVHLLPAKLSNMQLGILYSALKQLDGRADFDELLLQLDREEGNAKWTLINIIEYVKKLDLFSETPTEATELIKSGRCTIINLKGIQQDVQEVVVYKLLRDLFMERKRGNIAPFFLVLEEAHNFIPERNFGEAKSSGIIRQIFAEGRKFGLGACLISQRPSRVDKSALSQCTTQIILKVTNPNDVKAISNSVEGISSEIEKEIVNLSVGTAIVTGLVDNPLFVNIRPRKSKHGGEAIQIIKPVEETKEFLEETKDFGEKGDLLPVIKKMNEVDYKIINDVKNVKVRLIPCVLLNCFDKEEFNLLINLETGKVVKNFYSGDGDDIVIKMDLSSKQAQIFDLAVKLKEFKAADLFAKSGLQFGEVYDMIRLMEEKGFFTKLDGNKYKASRNFDVFSRLTDFKCFEKVDFENVKADETAEKKFSLEDVKEILSKYLEIKGSKECWLVNYLVK